MVKPSYIWYKWYSEFYLGSILIYGKGLTRRLPRCLYNKESICQCRRRRFDPWAGKIFWWRKRQSTIVSLSRKSHGQRSLVGYSPWSLKRVRCDLAAKQQQQTNGTGCWVCSPCNRASELPTKLWKALFCKGSWSRYLESFPFILPPCVCICCSSRWLGFCLLVVPGQPLAGCFLFFSFHCGKITENYHFNHFSVHGSLYMAMAPHSSTLAWKIPWTEEPGVLQSMGSLRVGHDSVASLSLFTFMHWRRKWQPTPVFLSRKSHGQRSLVGYSPLGHKSWTWLWD